MGTTPAALTHLEIGTGRGHDNNPAVLYHDLTPHHPDIRIVFDLEHVGDRHHIMDIGRRFVLMDHPAQGDGVTPVTFQSIRARDVLEHVSPRQLPHVMQFLWQHLNPEGILEIQVPRWGSTNAVIDPTHYRGFHIDSFDFFDPNTKLGSKSKFYGWHPWHILLKEVVPVSDVNLFFRLQRTHSS